MKGSLVTPLALGLVSALSCPTVAFSRQADKLQPVRLSVHVYNLSNATPRMMNQAMKEVRRIFDAAGLAIVWQERITDAPESRITDQHAGRTSLSSNLDSRNYIVVKIRPGFPDSGLPGALGYSLPDARFGPHAELFYNRIERDAVSTGTDVAVILGHAIAHELGHVLLGSSEHTTEGIMKARWGRTDHERAAKGCLNFTASQSDLIRRNASIWVNRGSDQSGPMPGPSGAVYPQ